MVSGPLDQCVPESWNGSAIRQPWDSENPTELLSTSSRVVGESHLVLRDSDGFTPHLNMMQFQKLAQLCAWHCWMESLLCPDHGHDIGCQDFRSADWSWEWDFVSSGKFTDDIANSPRSNIQHLFDGSYRLEDLVPEENFLPSGCELRDHREILTEGEIALSNGENRTLPTLGESAKCFLHAWMFLFLWLKSPQFRRTRLSWRSSCDIQSKNSWIDSVALDASTENDEKEQKCRFPTSG
jgi:hypothetical protein